MSYISEKQTNKQTYINGQVCSEIKVSFRNILRLTLYACSLFADLGLGVEFDADERALFLTYISDTKEEYNTESECFWIRP